MKLTDQEQVILKAIGQVGRGGLAEISKVVRAVGYPKATTKKVLVKLSEKGIVSLHRHDWPQSLKPEQRKLLVRLGSNYYNAVSVMKRNPKGKHLRGATAKQQRQYEAILKSIKQSGRYKGREKEVAARTVRARQNPKTTGKGKKALKATGKALKGLARGALSAGAQILGAGATALNPKRKRNRDYPYWNVYHVDTKKSPPYDKTFLGSSSFGMDKKEAIEKFRRSHYPGRLRAGTKIVAEKGVITMNPHGMSEKAWKAEENKYRKSIAAYRAKGWTFQQIKDRLWLAYGLTLHRLESDQAVFVDPFSRGGFTLDLNAPRRGRKTNPKKRNAAKSGHPSRSSSRRRIGASSAGRKTAKKTSVRSVAKARKVSVKRASSNPTRKGMRKLYREAKRISKVTRGRYFSSESGQRKAARHEKRHARKSKRNPSAESIRKQFAGSVNGERDLFFPQGTPAGKLAKLGKLVSITTKAGTIKPVRGTAWLCADTKGKLHIGSTSQAPLIDGPARNFGHVTKLEYESSKPHLGYKGPIIWFHRVGEENKIRPTLRADGKGGLVFKGGAYRLTSRGIEN